MVTRSYADEDEDDVEAIESQGVRDAIQEVFLERSQGNGVLPLDDLAAEIRRRGVFHLRTTATLGEIIGRIPDLVVAPAGMVLWTGESKHSVLLKRLRQVMAARTAPLPISLALSQLRRGNDRFPDVSEADVFALAAACADLQVDVEAGTISSGSEASMPLTEVLTGDELHAFNVLRRSFLSFSASEISSALGRRLAPAPSFIAMLEQSAVIFEDSPGRYKAVTQLLDPVTPKAPAEPVDESDFSLPAVPVALHGSPAAEPQDVPAVPPIPDDLATLPLFAGTAYEPGTRRGPRRAGRRV